MFLQGVDLQTIPLEVLPCIQHVWKIKKAADIKKTLLLVMQPYVNKFDDLQGVMAEYIDSACYGVKDLREAFPIKSKEAEQDDIQKFYDKLFQDS